LVQGAFCFFWMALLDPSCVFGNDGVNTTPSAVQGRTAVAQPRSVEAESAANSFDLEWEEWDGRLPFWKHAVAGSCAGIMEHLGMFPLDTVKTRMQVLRPGSTAVVRVENVLQEIVGDQGFRGFMRGCSAIAAGTVPAHVALFTTYELTKRRLLDGKSHDPVSAAFCGAASQFSHDLFLTPADVVKQRLQLGCHSSLSQCLRSIIQREGCMALFRSMPTTLAMNMPFGGILVASNESLKNCMALDESKDGRSALPWYFLSAGISGGIAAAMTQPLDVIKTRLQTQDCLAHNSDAPTHSTPCGRHLRPKYDSFSTTLKTIMREEGGRAFFYGLAPRVLYTIPAAAITWGTYESIKSLLTS